MLRAHLAKVVLTAGLGLAGGCSSLSNHSWFSHNKSRPAPDCDWVESGAIPYAEGPGVPDLGPYAIPPTPLPGPYPGVPQLTPPGGLQPIPQQAQPEPYVPGTPTRKSR